MRKLITILILAFITSPLIAQSNVRETKSERFSLFKRSSAPPSCTANTLTIYGSSTIGLQFSSDCIAWKALGSGLLTLNNTWSGTNTFSATITRSGGVLDIVASGAPSGACVTGSIYHRTNGTSGATLYVCEAATWAAK